MNERDGVLAEGQDNGFQRRGLGKARWWALSWMTCAGCCRGPGHDELIPPYLVPLIGGYPSGVLRTKVPYEAGATLEEGPSWAAWFEALAALACQGKG